MVAGWLTVLSAHCVVLVQGAPWPPQRASPLAPTRPAEHGLVGAQMDPSPQTVPGPPQMDGFTAGLPPGWLHRLLPPLHWPSPWLPQTPPAGTSHTFSSVTESVTHAVAVPLGFGGQQRKVTASSQIV